MRLNTCASIHVTRRCNATNQNDTTHRLMSLTQIGTGNLLELRALFLYAMRILHNSWEIAHFSPKTGHCNQLLRRKQVRFGNKAANCLENYIAICKTDSSLQLRERLGVRVREWREDVVWSCFKDRKWMIEGFRY